jgi:hypothetical protein
VALDIPATIVALSPAGVAIIGGMKFLYTKVTDRFDAIDKRLDDCQEYKHAQTTVIELLWQELLEHVPGSTVMARAKKLLDDLNKGKYGEH